MQNKCLNIIFWSILTFEKSYGVKFMKEIKIQGWGIAEIKKLMDMIANKGDASLLEVFDRHSRIFNRNSYSVRNFYYKLLKLYETDGKVARLLDENGIKNSTTSFHFNENDTEQLMKILLRNEGLSVRGACRKLARGDKKLMIRYQNKYRNTLKHNPQLVEKILTELRAENVRVRNFKSNISIMPVKEEKITEKEIQSLFWGLVRLVKRNAEEEIESTLKREAEFANTALQNSLIDLRRKEVLINELREQNKALKMKLENMTQNLQQSQQNLLGQMATISNLVGKSKIEELKTFIKGLSTGEQQINK